jgi:hypothetical protein
MDAEASATRPFGGRFERVDEPSTSHTVRHTVRVTRWKPSVGAIERPTRRVAAIPPSTTTTARLLDDPMVSYGRIRTPG